VSQVEAALGLFEEGCNCAQAVCAALGPDLGLPRETCLALGAGFGAGMGREGEVCGALSGGLMILGLRHGRGEADPVALKERVYERAQELLAGFRARHGTLRCRDLLGCDLKTPEGRQQSKDRDLHHAVCAGLVREVVEFLEAGT